MYKRFLLLAVTHIPEHTYYKAPQYSSRRQWIKQERPPALEALENIKLEFDRIYFEEHIKQRFSALRGSTVPTPAPAPAPGLDASAPPREGEGEGEALPPLPSAPDMDGWGSSEPPSLGDMDMGVVFDSLRLDEDRGGSAAYYPPVREIVPDKKEEPKATPTTDATAEAPR
jgi:hypothetical protein